jgi:hypothetical protein
MAKERAHQVWVQEMILNYLLLCAFGKFLLNFELYIDTHVHADVQCTHAAMHILQIVDFHAWQLCHCSKKDFGVIISTDKDGTYKVQYSAYAVSFVYLWFWVCLVLFYSYIIPFLSVLDSKREFRRACCCDCSKKWNKKCTRRSET